MPSTGSDIHSSPTTTTKLDIPHFNGTDPLGWIFKINQFFDYHMMAEDQKASHRVFLHGRQSFDKVSFLTITGVPIRFVSLWRSQGCYVQNFPNFLCERIPGSVWVTRKSHCRHTTSLLPQLLHLRTKINHPSRGTGILTPFTDSGDTLGKTSGREIPGSYPISGEIVPTHRTQNRKFLFLLQTSHRC